MTLKYDCAIQNVACAFAITVRSLFDWSPYMMLHTFIVLCGPLKFEKISHMTESLCKYSHCTSASPMSLSGRPLFLTKIYI